MVLDPEGDGTEPPRTHGPARRKKIRPDVDPAPPRTSSPRRRRSEGVAARTRTETVAIMSTQAILEAHVSAAPRAMSFTRHLPAAARVVMGLAFFVFGLDGFLHFIPQPTGPMPEGAVALGGAMMNSGYLLQLIKGTELVVGALLLSNRLVPLALALLAPVVVNIVAFHAFLAPDGMAMGLIVLALEVYLAWMYRDAYRPMLAWRAERS